MKLIEVIKNFLLGDKHEKWVVIGFLRSPSCATPADLLATSMAGKYFSPPTLHIVFVEDDYDPYSGDCEEGQGPGAVYELADGDRIVDAEACVNVSTGQCSVITRFMYKF